MAILRSGEATFEAFSDFGIHRKPCGQIRRSNPTTCRPCGPNQHPMALCSDNPPVLFSSDTPCGLVIQISVRWPGVPTWQPAGPVGTYRPCGPIRVPSAFLEKPLAARAPLTTAVVHTGKPLVLRIYPTISRTDNPSALWIQPGTHLPCHQIRQPADPQGHRPAGPVIKTDNPSALWVLPAGSSSCYIQQHRQSVASV